MLSDEEKNSMELDIEAKYAGRTEKEFLNNITYAECLYILDTKNKYCDDIKNLSLLKIVDIVNEQSKEIEELKKDRDEYKEEYIKLQNARYYNYISKDKIKAKIEEYQKQIEKMEKDDIGVGFTLGKEWSDLKAKVEFGQSLLEKE